MLPIKNLLKKAVFGFLIAILAVIFAFLVGGVFLLKSFSLTSGLSFNQIYQKLSVGKYLSANFNNKKVNILILGLDSGKQERENGILTDTIIVLSIDTAKKTIKSFSIPRDLWLDSLKTKVNALYYYGEADKNTSGEKYTRENLGQILGLTLDYYLLIDFSSLKDIVDILGGLEINVPETFDDYKFPKPHSDQILNGSPSALFEHIHFDKGLQKMNGEEVLKYVRSRQSENIEEGSDLARSKRQQQVIQTLIGNLTNHRLIKQPKTLGQLYFFWKKEVKTNFKDEEIIAIALNLLPKLPKFETVNLSVSNEENPEVLIYHPPAWQQWQYNNQWVYIPSDSTWFKLQKFIKNQLD